MGKQDPSVGNAGRMNYQQSTLAAQLLQPRFDPSAGQTGKSWDHTVRRKRPRAHRPIVDLQ